MLLNVGKPQEGETTTIGHISKPIDYSLSQSGVKKIKLEF